MNELKIVTVEELLKENLSIPTYQRPYRWSTDSAATLFKDVYSAFDRNLPEYRIGSVILHNDTNCLDIVDGQQRITTLIILAFCIAKIINDYSFVNKIQLLRRDFYNNLSLEAILKNFDLFIIKCKDFTEQELRNYQKYLLTKCTFVKIITGDEQEAFQFFDSQNSRGKELAPHDLLKSYHLREMKYDDESEKVQIINKWEGTNQKKLRLFFSNHLYPLVRWYKSRDGLSYSSRKINIFKGIKQNNGYNFSIYHKASNLYIEYYNRQEIYELNNGEQLNQYQLTQPIIAGKRFFQFTLHYFDLYNILYTRITDFLNSYNMDLGGTGNGYIKNLFINICIFFSDKFNLSALTESRLKRLCYWAYSLRIVMHAVYLGTVNNYALGYNDRLNFGLNLFKEISDMQTPQELDLISFRKISVDDMTTYNTNYIEIFNALEEIDK